MKTCKGFFNASLVGALLAFSGARTIEAQTVWATAASGNWNTDASWNPALTPGNGANASIIVAGTFTVTYNSPMSAGSIASLTLGSASSIPTLTITAAGFNVAGTTTLADSATEVLNINSGGVMTNGTLNMNSRNALVTVNSGGTITNANTQVANNGSNDGPGKLTVNSGATANLGAVTVGRNNQSASVGLQIAGGNVFATSIDVGIRNSYSTMAVSGGTVTNSGNFRLGTGSATAGRETRFTQTGGTVGNAGTADIAVAANYTTWFSVLNSGSTFLADGIRIFPNAVSGAVARCTNSGTIYLGASGFNVLNSGTYTVALNDQSILGATADWSGNVNMGTPGSGTITFKAADSIGTAHTITLTGVISGGANVVKSGAGALALNTANTYTGGTTVSGGSLVLGNATALPQGTALTIGGSGTAGIVDLAGFNPQLSGLTTAGVAANQLITNSSAVNPSTLTFSNSAANLTFGGVIAGGSKPVALTLLGGNLTLSAQNNYAGNIFVSNGKLALSGSGATFTGPAIVLSNAAAILDLTGMNTLPLTAGQSFSGFGAVTGNVTAANCPITPGANGSGGTLTLAGNLTLNGNVTNQFDLLLDPNGAGNDLINVSGALNVSGLNAIKLNALGGSLSEGTYHLIKSASVGSGATNNFQLTGAPGSGLQAALSVTVTGVDLVVFQAGGAERVWVGDGSANLWDLWATNWWNAGFADTFTNGNFVIFDDTATNFTASLTGTLQPASITVDATNNFTFSGAGKIGGVVVLTKTNSSTLTILTTNDYNGLTIIGQGTLQVGNGVTSGALGTGSLVNNGRLLMQQPNSSTLSNAVSGVGSLGQAGTATLTLAGNNTFSGGATVSSGILQIGNGGTIGNGNVTNHASLIFNNSTSNNINGVIRGPGSLTILSGTLFVNNAIGDGPTTVAGGARLGGSGKVGGSLTINRGGILMPGNSLGTLTIASNLTMDSGSILNFDLGTSSDRVVVSNNLSLICTLNVTNSGGLTSGTYTLFTYGGSLLMSVVTVGSAPAGKLYAIDTATPGQVNLIVGTIATNIPAFPGALGFGSPATGGRGGTIYHVTSLADSGAGSFRDAVSQSGRTVIFDVGGYISLVTAVSVKGNLTIAGQTAPGGGIGFKGGEISFANSSNIICRFLRIRPGSDTASTGDDCLSLYQAKSVIVDHVSLEFGPWNNIDAVGCANITVQNSINANPTFQQFGAHTESVGQNFSWFYNLFANSHNRNPLAKINNVFINNVLYNYSAGYTTHTSTAFKHDLVNNYFICGPGSGGGGNTWFQIDNNQSMYFTGNLRDNNLDGALNGSATVPLPGYQGGGAILNSPWSSWTTAVPIYTLNSAYRIAVSQAGALPRDEMDSLLLGQVKTLGLGPTGTGAGTAGPGGGLYTTQTSTGLGNNGYGTIASGAPPLDSDNDGMADFWETALSLDANNSSDSTNLTLSGYTQLELYLNWLAAPHVVANSNIVNVDLAQYANGFTNVSPVYAVSAAVNGIAALLPDGQTAQFTAASNFVGQSSFKFTVAGNDGSHLTNTVGLVFSTVAPPQDLIWRGNGSANTWDNGATTTWFNGASLDTFSGGDTVTFDDSGSNTPAINLVGPLKPSSVTVAANQNYTFSGSGVLSGAMSLIKSGAGTLTLNTVHTYSGGTTINGGSVVLGISGAASSGAVSLSGGGTLQLSGGDFLNPLAVANTGTVSGNVSANDTLKGAISGAGAWNLNILSGRVITEESDQASFAGRINLTGPGTYRLNQGSFTWGNPNVAFDLGANGTLNNRSVANTTLQLGALTGGGDSKLRASDQSTSSASTYQVGALNLDSVFDGTLQDGGGATPQKLALTKIGTGTLTLNGTNTSSGSINVNSGALLINGVVGTGAVTVATSTLGGAGRIAGNVSMQSGANLSPGLVSASAGTLTLSNNLTLTTANLRYDLNNVTTPGSGVNDLVSLNGGTLTLSGVSTVIPNYLNGPLASGAYTLINGGAATTGTAANLSWGGVAGTRQSFSFDLAIPGSVLLQVSGTPPAALLWSGTNGNSWDINSTLNWLNAGAADKFFNLDSVVFNDASTNGNVSIATTVQPGTISVSNDTLAYHFASGGISGATSLQKSGAGSLTLSGSNSFTGGVTIQGGDIFLANDIANQSALGTGAVTLAGGTLNMFSSAATTNIASWNLIVPATFIGRLNADPACDLYGNLNGGGTFNFFIPSTKTTLYGDWSAFTGGINVLTATSGDFRMANLAGLPAASLNLASNINAFITVDPGADTTVEIGELSGATTSQLLGAPSASVLTWRIGGKNTDATLAGTIAESDTNTTTAIEKIGAGVWTLSGGNSYRGDTTVLAGTLRVSNPTGSATGFGALEVSGGATLSGNGVIGGDTILDNDAILTPGNDAIGRLTFRNALTFSASSTNLFELNKTSATNDSVKTFGAVTYGGTLIVTNRSGALAAHDRFKLFDAATYAGSFSAVQLPALAANLAWDASQLATNGVIAVVSIAPPPPLFGAINLSGNDLIFRGSNGTAGTLFYVLGSTNVAEPASNWLRLLTNQFDATGNFLLTNPLSPGAPQNFYRLQLP